MHIGFTYTLDIVECAAQSVLEIVDIRNGKCVFLSSGSEAVEFAVQAALRISEKPKLLTMVDSFLASYGSAGKKPTDQWYCFDWQVCQDCSKSEACDPGCEMIAAIPFEDIGAWVFELGSSSGLVRFPPKGLIKVLEEKIRGHGSLIITNEVTTGMGRTGKWFGYQHYDLIPDVVALGKGLGNGYPVSAIAMTADVADRLQASGFHYAQSHQNDPLGCAVAKELIAVLQEDLLIDQCRAIGAYFLDELQFLAKTCSQIADVRGRGLMLAVQFDPANKDISARAVFHHLFERGVIVGCKADPNLIRFLPPLVITKEDVTSFLRAFEDVLSL